MWLIILASVLSLFLYFLAIKPYKHWEKKGVPYIKPLPFIGNIAPGVFQRKSFPDLLKDVYFSFPNERYIGFYQFLSPAFILRDLELIKRVTVKDFDTFPEHKALTSDEVDPLWSKNLFAMKGGQKWQDMRATLSPSFTSSKMRLMFDLMKNCSKQFTDYFLKQGGTVTVNLKDSCTRFTNDVIATTAFGVSCNSLENQENEFYLMGKEATDFTGIRALRFSLSTISPKLMKMLKITIFSKAVSTFFRKLIKEALSVREEKGIIRPDMIHLLMEARKGRLQEEDSNKVVDSGFAVVQESDIIKTPKRQKAEITDEVITAQALIFFIAGFETASNFMCFTAYELAVNSDVQEKLRREVDETLEACNGSFTYEALLGMKYLDMVVTESLRKWPPNAALDRMSVKSFTIEPTQPGEKPIHLEKGTNVWIPVFALHRDPKYFPNPEKFDPERFSEENRDKIEPYSYVPFGAGPRNCIGSRFALLEGKLIIAEIVSKFEIVPVERTQIPLELHKGSFILLPEKGFWLGLKPRSKN